MYPKTSGPDEHGYAYIYLADTGKVKRTISTLANIDVDKDGKIVGVELLSIPDNITFGQ